MKIAFVTAALAAALLPAHAAPVYGDVNGDGLLDGKDAALLLKAAGGLAPLNDTIRRNGDVAPLNDYQAGSFGDGRITLDDAVRVEARVANPSAANWPAVRTGYLLEVGNTYTYREYDATGAANSGPGTSRPDDVTTISRTQQETVNGQPVTAYTLTSDGGQEQHLINTTYAPGRDAIALTQGTFGGTNTTFNPPLFALVYPVEAGQTWSGTTVAAGLNATYQGRIDGPESVTTPAGTFDNAYRVTITYSAPVFGSFAVTGYEKAWFVPFLGPVQRGFSKSVPFQGTTTIDPQAKLSSALVHGVKWP